MATFKRVSGKFKIKKRQVFNVQIKRRLPLRLAVTIERHFREGFEQGGHRTDESRGGWKARKKSEKGGRRGILIKSGTLRRDIRQRAARFDLIKVGTSNTTIDYADVHNSGLRSGRGSGFTMPKREFIGASRNLDEKINKIISGELRRMLI